MGGWPWSLQLNGRWFDHFLCPKLGVGDGLRVGPWHWKLSKWTRMQGENTAVFQELRGAALVQTYMATVFPGLCLRVVSVFNVQTCVQVDWGCDREKRLWTRRSREQPWRRDRLTRFISYVREAGESVEFCPLVIPDNDVKPAELVQADIWKHTTLAICCSVSQGNSLLTIRHRAHPLTKAY